MAIGIRSETISMVVFVIVAFSLPSSIFGILSFVFCVSQFLLHASNLINNHLKPSVTMKFNSSV